MEAPSAYQGEKAERAMDNQVDSTVRRVSRELTHPRPGDLEASILVRIAHAREARAGRWRMDALAFLGALAVGLGGAVTIAAPNTASTVASLGEVSKLAPSALLDRGR